MTHIGRIGGFALEIEGVSKTFHVTGKPLTVLRDVSLVMPRGEFVAIVGASGCGKSTLLRLILGLDTDYEGEIRVDGQRVRRPGLDRAIVFQEHRLLPWLTAEGNVAVALRRSGLPRAERRQRVAELLDLVGLSAFAGAWPAQLSGGMAQRVAIARALVNRPRFLLMDEPLGALDALTRLRLQGELARIVRHQGSTALLVTHDVDEAVFLADRIVIMHPHPGRVATVLTVGLGAARDRSAPAFLAIRDQVLDLLGVTPAATRAEPPPGSVVRHFPVLASFNC
ncbi:taurine ABC transporter ATP binding subunit [Rhodovastum atsumiense]|uniref:ABC transporter ATP-binding protein n=1 Tax=Rhodovastum atsumiense TaxID=504468 RepID=A0A5M6IWK6_9PROT|nr:ABC transporter ATP-binding protein [Rhodovastum atsumiense]KAA5612611.1 ABC transporter ATP-binding protein [Rhodovastum atsumiense]CAH2601290.1 taurine ABC transporter ATP binding subunit [Rhodovastum atsumiense]